MKYVTAKSDVALSSSIANLSLRNSDTAETDMETKKLGDEGS